jgi:hypothetical protein
LGSTCFFGTCNKLTLNYQNRPVYQANTIGELKVDDRKANSTSISNRNKLNNNYYGKLYFKNRVKYEFLVLGTHFLGMVFFLDLVPGNPGVTITAAIAVVMALWWVTEALPMV